MQYVLTFGIWDLLHIGHLIYLEEAKALGDRLIVGVAGDEAVLLDKGRYPIIPQEERAYLVDSLSVVDRAIIYEELDFMPLLEGLQPDVLVTASTWGKEERHVQAEQYCLDNDCKLVRLAYHNGQSTTQIVNKILKERT